MLIRLTIYLLSVVSTTLTTAELSNRVPKDGDDPSTISQSTAPNYRPEIINELKDFRSLIPQATIDEIVAKHFVIDGDFRHAIKFLRSSNFKQLIQKAEQLPEILEILDFLHLIAATGGIHQKVVVSQNPHDDEACDVNSRRKKHWENTIDNLPVQIELLPYAGEDADALHLRSFTTFVEEVLQHLPHNSYVSMIEEKRKRNADFAEFYAALRSPSLQQMADAAMKTPNVANIVQTLKSNNIDTNALEPIILRVISWGPIA